MADTRLTKVGFLLRVRLCGFAVLTPAKLVEAEDADEQIRRGFPQPPPPPEPRAFKVRRAFWASLALVLSSVLVGYAIGLAIVYITRPVSSAIVATFQVLGATTLLWGTLFVRGWDIQTFGGVSLTERVNHWIYRFLYCAGTALIVASLTISDWACAIMISACR